jgi:hypothetical protein
VGGNSVRWSDRTGLKKGDRWYGYNDREFQRWFHHCWKQSGNADADQEEIAEAYADWVSRGSPVGGKCDNNKKPFIQPIELMACGYILYRAVRAIPSLTPPLWWTMPANLLTP